MILCSLEYAVSAGIEPWTDWETVVSKSHVQQSKMIIDYIIEQNFAPEVIIPVCGQIDKEGDSSFDDASMKYLDKFLQFKGSLIQFVTVPTHTCHFFCKRQQKQIVAGQGYSDC